MSVLANKGQCRAFWMGEQVNFDVFPSKNRKYCPNPYVFLKKRKFYKVNVFTIVYTKVIQKWTHTKLKTYQGTTGEPAI
jgi:hypothetical protein